MTGLLLLAVLFLVTKSQGSGLHGFCSSDENCGTFDTYCKNGTCICKEHFAPVYDTCIQLAAPPIKCLKKHDCHSMLGPRSICKDQKCGCKSFHHIYNGMCVKSRGVEEVCELDHQCYCGSNCEERIQCAENVCVCRPGFLQESRRCLLREGVSPVASAISTTEISTTAIAAAASSQHSSHSQSKKNAASSAASSHIRLLFINFSFLLFTRIFYSS